jgi:hypothetical protein
MKETDQLYSFIKKDASLKNKLWISRGYVIKRETHLINPFVEDVEESTTMLLIKNKMDYLS